MGTPPFPPPGGRLAVLLTGIALCYTLAGCAAKTVAQGARVSGNGDVTLPYLGQVRADGLTPDQLGRDIASRLVARGILKRPQVSVNVVEYRSRVVAVVGAVERPGVFPTARPG